MSVWKARFGRRGELQFPGQESRFSEQEFQRREPQFRQPALILPPGTAFPPSKNSGPRNRSAKFCPLNQEFRFPNSEPSLSEFKQAPDAGSEAKTPGSFSESRVSILTWAFPFPKNDFRFPTLKPQAAPAKDSGKVRPPRFARRGTPLPGPRVPVPGAGGSLHKPGISSSEQELCSVQLRWFRKRNGEFQFGEQTLFFLSHYFRFPEGPAGSHQDNPKIAWKLRVSLEIPATEPPPQLRNFRPASGAKKNAAGWPRLLGSACRYFCLAKNSSTNFGTISVALPWTKVSVSGSRAGISRLRQVTWAP